MVAVGLGSLLEAFWVPGGTFLGVEPGARMPAFFAFGTAT